ncbi:efflux RND transporter periplasmic adaptor subunit [Oryzibacter oryziterrae]|uniref:efflux RND transporter periplasmic adaptor subunit n=1 Tax=Oryzibacter oryziterrae TaxID=2766474 RepID=UPI001F015207|nr:efflux RND transporter periplasmic adaptor subunit [Oryzibacter oryziterrae]
MAFWKQFLIVVGLVVAGIAAWGAYDPSARSTLVSLGVPEAALPAWAFTAKAEDATAAASGGKGQHQGGGQGGGQGAGQGGGHQGGGGRQGGGFGGPALVITAPATDAITADRVEAIGTAEAARTVALFPRSSGMVTAVPFEAGQRVAEGDVLLKLDDDVETIAVETAKVALSDAQAKVARYDKLVANQSIATVDRDTALSDLTKAQLSLKQAELDLSRRVTHAPFSGIIGLTSVEVGDMVSASTQLATLDDRSRLKVEFRVPEAFAARVSLNETVAVTTPSQPGKSFDGTVSAVGSQIEADSRTLVVQAVIDNAADLLRPGMSFLVTLHFPGEHKVAVPAVSVQWDRDGSYVWRITDGKAERVGVTIVERNADTVLLDGPLAAGDAIVTEGLQGVKAGAAVRLGTTDPSGAVTPVADAGAAATPGTAPAAAPPSDGTAPADGTRKHHQHGQDAAAPANGG